MLAILKFIYTIFFLFISLSQQNLCWLLLPGNQHNWLETLTQCAVWSVIGRLVFWQSGLLCLGHQSFLAVDADTLLQRPINSSVAATPWCCDITSKTIVAVPVMMYGFLDREFPPLQCTQASFHRKFWTCFLACAVAMMFVRLSVRLSGTGVHCDHTVHFSTDLSVWLDSPVFWTPWHQSMSTYSQPSFSSSTWKRGAVWMCKLGVISQERLKIEVRWLLSANRKSYMPRRLAQQRMTLSDLEWQFHQHRLESLR